MPIVVNGTTIPENVANSLNVNGTNITSVVCDGITVWTQSLFNATWSGGDSTAFQYILSTSGSLARLSGNSIWTTGGWVSVNTDGTFTAGTSESTANGFTNTLYFGTSAGLPNQLRIRFKNSYLAPALVSFSINGGFSGESIANSGTGIMGLQTSGGLIRMYSFYSAKNYYGTWLTLS